MKNDCIGKIAEEQTRQTLVIDSMKNDCIGKIDMNF